MASYDHKSTLYVMALPEESQGLLEKIGIVPFFTGIGQVKAAFSLTKAIADKKPLRIINLGTAGSFNRNPGELVECTSFVQRQSTLFMPKSRTLHSTGRLTELPSVVCGTADFVQHAFSGGEHYDVMDMEAYALAYVAAQSNVPFYCIKFITDHSGEDVVTEWKTNLKFAAEKLAETVKAIS